MSVLLGYLAHWDKRLKAERSLIARAMGRAQPDLGLSRTIEGVLDEILQFYDSNIALLPVLDRFTGRAYLTEYRIARDALPKVRITEIQPQDQEAWLFTSEAHAWHGFVSRKQGAGTFAVNEKGLHLPECRIDVRPDWVRQYEARSSLAVNVVFGEELSGRLYLLNPQLRGTRMTEVAFIQRFAQQVAPVIYTVYLWRRLRSKIGGIERAQIARDLHDGVIQSMVTLEMSIDVARTETEGAQRDTLLAKVQKLLRNEIHTLRELTHQLRGVNIRPGELVPYLVDMVERFGRDSGIHARLVSDNEDVVLPQRVCRNIVAIVQEALANVRKHSGARKVLVRFNCERGVWTLVIDDDGSGFDFSGALSFVELEEMRKGPVSIKERVRLLKGDLIIESNPGAGCRIFISAPVRAWA
jgi:signal transduction histidine kinase